MYRVGPRSSPSATNTTLVRGPVGLEGPGPVDRLRALDDMYVKACRPIELRELDNLLELLDSGWFRAFPNTCPQPGWPIGELLHRRLGRLPVTEVRRVRHVIKDRLRRCVHDERFNEPHGHLVVSPRLPQRHRTRRNTCTVTST